MARRPATGDGPAQRFAVPLVVEVLIDVAMESIVGMEANHDSSPDHSDGGRS